MEKNYELDTYAIDVYQAYNLFYNENNTKSKNKTEMNEIINSLVYILNEIGLFKSFDTNDFELPIMCFYYYNGYKDVPMYETVPIHENLERICFNLDTYLKNINNYDQIRKFKNDELSKDLISKLGMMFQAFCNKNNFDKSYILKKISKILFLRNNLVGKVETIVSFKENAENFIVSVNGLKREILLDNIKKEANLTDEELKLLIPFIEEKIGLNIFFKYDEKQVTYVQFKIENYTSDEKVLKK